MHAAALLLALLPAAQTPEKDALRLKPLVPAPPAAEPQAAAAGAGEAAAVEQPAGPPVDDGVGPRPLPAHLTPPFEYDRPLLQVDGARIMASELNELVLYYRSFKEESVDMLLMQAVAALLPSKVVQARYGDDLIEVRRKGQDALDAARAGADFAAVVAEYSDDSEAENPEGRYTFGRERAVQPFDRLAFTAEPGGGPTDLFLTKYGFHFLEPLDYERGAIPRADRATMRHVLVMYPGLKRIEESGQDVRAWINAQLAVAKIRVLAPGLANLVPPEYRAQIVP